MWFRQACTWLWSDFVLHECHHRHHQHRSHHRRQQVLQALCQHQRLRLRWRARLNIVRRFLWMPRLRSVASFDRLVDDILDADPVALCSGSHFARTARVVITALREYERASDISPTCPGCQRAHAVAAGVNTSTQVIDGHQKWSRRACCMRRVMHKQLLPDVSAANKVQRVRWEASGKVRYLMSLDGCCPAPSAWVPSCARHASRSDALVVLRLEEIPDSTTLNLPVSIVPRTVYS